MAKYTIDNIPSQINFEIGTDMVARTLQNAKNLLMTHLCEIPYDRYRGFNTALYDLPITKVREALLPELDRIMMWEPDVTVVDAQCKLDDGNYPIIEVTLEINING